MRKTKTLSLKSRVHLARMSLSRLFTLGSMCLFALIASVNINYAQNGCALVCEDEINVSLDTVMDGTVQITVSMLAINEDSTCTNGDLYVELYDKQGNMVTDAIVTCSNVGWQLTGKVKDRVTGNSCWGYINVEDKVGPNLNCTIDTIYCSELDMYYQGLDRFPLGMAYDNCGVGQYPVTISMFCEEFTCEENREFSAICTRTVVAKDPWGQLNKCNDIFYVRRVDVDESNVLWPDDTMFECSEENIYDADSNGVVDPEVAGTPMVVVEIDEGVFDTISLYPNSSVCKVFATFKDHEIEICGTGKKIMRQWKVVDWCQVSSELDPLLTMNQWIKIKDETPPTIDAYDDVSIYADPFKCNQKYEIEYPENIEDCNLIKRVTYSVEHMKAGHPGSLVVQSGEINPGGVGVIYLPAGWHDVYITVTDECLNHRYDTFTVHVIDRNPPNPVCDEITQTTLDPKECSARIYAKSFDDGSHDNCCDYLYFSAAKMSLVDSLYDYWHNEIKSSLGDKDFYKYHEDINRFIDIWLGCHVFKEYVEWDGCLDLDNNVIVRVYQACEIPHYDPHLKHYGYDFVSENDFFCLSAYGEYGKSIFEIDDIDDFHVGDIEDLAINHPYRLFNECMVEVLVEDKVPPVCIPEEDVTVFCDGVEYEKDTWLWSGPCNEKSGGYGVMSEAALRSGGDSPYKNAEQCDELHELDNEGGIRLDPDALFTTPEIYDNCGDVTITDTIVGHIDDCGEGYREKRWTIVDQCGNETFCHQRVYVKHRSDFEVIFPPDMTFYCGDVGALSDLDDEAITEITGLPEVSDDECEQIGISYQDELFEIIDEACFKILRTWTIIDWCVFNPDKNRRRKDIYVSSLTASESRSNIARHLKDNGDGYMVYTQVIKVRDTIGPEIDDSRLITQVNCADDPELCNGDASIKVFGSDNCTPADDLKWNVFIKYDGDDEFTHVKDTIGECATLFGDFEVGTHTARFVLLDRCGNADFFEWEFTIELCKLPTPYCFNGLAIPLMPIDSGGMIRVWASDMDAGGFAYCNQQIVAVSFSSNPEDTMREYTCADLGGQAEVQVPVQIWYTDSYGNQDFCTTYILLQANAACGQVAASKVGISGTISTEGRENVQSVEVVLKGSSSAPSVTGPAGTFAFPSMPLGGDYSIIPGKQINPLNGVSTLDLVVMQKHILGLERLNSPYKYIAADIDMSGSITAVDIVKLRKLILGIEQDFGDNHSWRFVDASYQFTDQMNPLKEDFPEAYNIEDLAGTMADIDFIGIKVGDVNGSAQANELQQGEIRSVPQPLSFDVKDGALEAGQTYEVAISSSNFEEIMGYQLTLEFDVASLQLVGIEGAALDLHEGNFGLHRTGEGMISTSWQSSKPITVDADEPLFIMRFQVIQSAMIRNVIDMNSAITRAEAYDRSYQIMDIEMKYRTEEGLTDVFELYQNTPNPFESFTKISFNLPEASQATLLIYDVTGKAIREISGEFSKGYNEVKIRAVELETAGVLYYQLSTDKYTATKKMILVK